MEKNNLINATNISKRFGKKKVLKNIDLTINENERIAIVGGNGAGKTTLLNILSKNDNKYTGKLEISVKSSEMSFQFQTINYPNELNLISLLNLFTIKRKGINRKKDIKASLESVDLYQHKKKYPSELSGGQLQKFNLLMTMATNPKLIFFDEILSGLDQPSIQNLINYIKDHIHNKATTITISHNPFEIWELCDRVMFLKDGSIIGDYEMSSFESIDDLENLMKETINEDNQIDYDGLMIKEKDYSHIDENQPSVYVKKLKKWYDLHDVLIGQDDEGINTTFKAGDIVAIIGKNGSGKSTFAEIVGGVKKPSKGKVDIDIFDTHSKPYHNFRKSLHDFKYSFDNNNVQFKIDKYKSKITQDPSNEKRYQSKIDFYKKKRDKIEAKLKKNVVSKLKKNIKNNKKASSHITSIQFQKQFYPSMLSVMDVIVYNLQMAKIDYDDFYIDLILDSIGLLGSKNSSTHELSGGQRQKLNIILSIIRKPALLVLDELTTGLDLLAQERLLNLIKKFSKIEKPIILMVTHSLEDIESLANRLIMIHEGDIEVDMPYDVNNEEDRNRASELLHSLDI